MFERKIKVIEIEGQKFEAWINPPRGKMQEAAQGGNATFLGYLVQAWSLGGKEYEGYKFPPKPTVEACDQLPVDVQEGVAVAISEAINNSLPKMKGGG